MKRLAELRKSKQLSQLALGNLLNSAQETISGYENGRSEPDYPTLIKIANFFDVSIDYLLERTDLTHLNSSENITSLECELLSSFARLDEPNKHRALGIILGLTN